MNDVHVEFKSKLIFLIGSIQLLACWKVHIAKFLRKNENTFLEEQQTKIGNIWFLLIVFWKYFKYIINSFGAIISILKWFSNFIMVVPIFVMMILPYKVVIIISLIYRYWFLMRLNKWSGLGMSLLHLFNSGFWGSSYSNRQK